MTDPFALTDEAPSPAAPAAQRRATPAPARAHVHPARIGQKPFEAALLGRVGNNKVKIRLGQGTTFAVDRFRLYAVEKVRGVPRERLSVDQLDALPWLGAGPDPLLAPQAASAPPWSAPGSAR